MASEPQGGCDSGHHLLLFARFPRAGFCKTRLIPRLGEQGSAQFCWSALVDLLHLLSQLPIRKTWLYTPASAGDDALQLLQAEGLDSAWNVQAQMNASQLGDRLKHAFEWATTTLPVGVSTSLGAVAFMGMDCFDLTPAHIMGAVDGTADNVAQILPARDGGYVLLSLPATCPSTIFDNIPWSCEETCKAQVARIKESGLHVRLGEELDDVDDASDLERLLEHKDEKRATFPRLMKYLDTVVEQ